MKEAVNKKIAVEFVHSNQQKMKNIYLKEDNGKLWVEVIIDTLLIPFRSSMSSQQAINEVKLVESQTVHFARLKSSSRFEKINRNSTAITLSLVCPLK